MSQNSEPDSGTTNFDTSSVNINEDSAFGPPSRRLDTESPIHPQPSSGPQTQTVNNPRSKFLVWLFSISSLSLTTNITAVRWKMILLAGLATTIYLLTHRPHNPTLGSAARGLLGLDALLELSASMLLLWKYKKEHILHAMWGPRLIQIRNEPQTLNVPVMKDLLINSAIRFASFGLSLMFSWIPFVSELAAFMNLAQGCAYIRISKELSRENFGHTEVDQNTELGKKVQVYNKAALFRLFSSIKLPQPGTLWLCTVAEACLLWLCADGISLISHQPAELCSNSQPHLPGVLLLVLVGFAISAVGFFVLVIPSAITLCSCLLAACSCWTGENVSLHALQLSRILEKALSLLATTSLLKITAFGYGIQRICWKMYLHQTAISTNKDSSAYHSPYEATQLQLALASFIKEQEMYIEILRFVSVVSTVYLVLINLPLNFWMQTRISLEYGIELNQSLLLITARQPLANQNQEIEIQPTNERQTPELVVLKTPYYLTLKRINKTYFEFGSSVPQLGPGSSFPNPAISPEDWPIKAESQFSDSTNRPGSTNISDPTLANQETPAANITATPEGNLCAICISQPEQTLIGPCGHGGLCFSCIRDSWKQNNLCPFCRRPIHKVHIFADKSPESPGQYLVVQELVGRPQNSLSAP